MDELNVIPKTKRIQRHTDDKMDEFIFSVIPKKKHMSLMSYITRDVI